VASFTNLSISGAAGDADAELSPRPGSPEAVSTTITVGAGAATQLTLTTSPRDGAERGGVSPSMPVVQLAGLARANPVGQSGVTVTAAIATGAGRWVGTLPARRGSGVATFTNLEISGAAGDGR